MSSRSPSEWEETLRDLLEAAKHHEPTRHALQELVRLVASSKHEVQGRTKKSPVLNPFNLYREGGESALAEKLNSMSLGELLAVVKAYGLDPSRKSHKWKTEQRLVDLIRERVRSTSSRGDVFTR
jgi:hypothetical protein